ncbi:hypothetical protein FACS1894125_7090 [Actinomycetota bacterium]|nr:hypothetical protein FACS1894125_7090 [Actinomycetota bacterium]
MLYLDTNVILRLILQDNDQVPIAVDAILRNDCFTIPEVIEEVVYVLQSVYKVDRKDVKSYLDEVVYGNDIQIKYHSHIRRALETYANTKLSYVDCILATIAYEGIKVLTFDKDLQKHISTEQKS